MNLFVYPIGYNISLLTYVYTLSGITVRFHLPNLYLTYETNRI